MGSPICFKEIVAHLKPFGIVDVGVRQFLTLLDENGWIIFRNKVHELSLTHEIFTYFYLGRNGLR